VSVHAVLAAPHLLLYLTDPHVAIPFAYRLSVTDQFWPPWVSPFGGAHIVSALKVSTSMPKGELWTFGRGVKCMKSGYRGQALGARAGPSG
jgi:hypothetical protein